LFANKPSKSTIWPKELSGLRIAVIGDLHTGGPFITDQKLRRIVELTNQQHPDLIVLLGDYMSPNSWHSHRVEPESDRGGLKDLSAPLGVYTILAITIGGTTERRFARV